MDISLKNKQLFQPHIKKGRFYNYNGEKKPPFIVPSLFMLLEWYISHKNRSHIDISNWVEKTNNNYNLKEKNFAITWIGHASFLIQTAQYNILTDPVFGALSLLFPRILPVGIEPANLPKIDFVIISHNHRDHMDTKSLLLLKKNNPEIIIMVPKGDQKWFDKRNFKNIIENNWWETNSFENIKFSFLPAYHWSQRGILDYNKSLWGSWMISVNNKNIYFAGDTAYADHFKAISEEFNISTALMPIGPCEPREWMRNSHVSAEEAGYAFLDLKADNFIPMHWGTYHFGTDQFDLPYNRLIDWWEYQLSKNKLENKNLITLKVGQKLNIDL